MRILITGHKGFIGQNMMEALADHELTGYEWGDEPYSLDNIDRVIHLGAISSTSCTDIEALRAQNIMFSYDLINRCIERRIPIQIASSASVYGKNNTTFKETDVAWPDTLYAHSKLLVEREYLMKGLPSTVQFFRYFNVYGKYEDHKGDQASPYSKFRKQAEQGEIRLFGGSANFKRDFVPVETVIDVHKKFFDITDSGVWNIGTGEATSFKDVAKQIASETGAKIVEIPMPENLRKGYQAYTKADLTKLNNTLEEKWKT
jgi:ADP-L-glycero-D-manno-heptose 6-epimerase